uniref:Uncharacterized protein n=1 Tax=Setaria italica TaxID=4555 RepID=K4A4F4_SETIT
MIVYLSKITKIGTPRNHKCRDGAVCTPLQGGSNFLWFIKMLPCVYRTYF